MKDSVLNLLDEFSYQFYITVTLVIILGVVQKRANQTYPTRFSIFVLFLPFICYITLGEMGDSLLLYAWMGKRLAILYKDFTV